MADKMKTIAIKGKNYVQVTERVKAFRNNPAWIGWSIVTDIHELTDDVCVMCAKIINPDSNVIATGWGREVRNDAASMVNKTSYVENCETSAVGRALGFLGIGIEENICSAEELVFALQAQEQAKPAPTAPVQTKGGAIYPAKEPEQASQEETLSPEQKQFKELMKQIQDATTWESLKAIMATAKSSPYWEALRQVGNNKARANNWHD